MILFWEITKEKILHSLRSLAGFVFLSLMQASLQRSEKKMPAALAEGFFLLSGWQDSNLRPSGPKPDALTGLRYTPFCRRPQLARRWSSSAAFFDIQSLSEGCGEGERKSSRKNRTSFSNNIIIGIFSIVSLLY